MNSHVISSRILVQKFSEVTTNEYNFNSITQKIYSLDVFNVFYDHYFTIFCNKSKVTRNDITGIQRHLLRTRAPASLGHQASTH